MKLTDNRDNKNITYDDLQIGRAFLDEDGDISIKVNDDVYLYYDDNVWDINEMFNPNMKVTPLESELIIK